MIGTIEEREVALGNLTFLKKLYVKPGGLPVQAKQDRELGQTVMYVLIDGQVAGLLGVTDPVKPSSAQAIADLRQEGVEVVMLTGDNAVTARAVANKLGIVRLEAEVLPE